MREPWKASEVVTCYKWESTLTIGGKVRFRCDRLVANAGIRRPGSWRVKPVDDRGVQDPAWSIR